MECVVIDEQTYPIDTQEEIQEAKAAMAALGIEIVDVWYTPTSLEWIEENGDPDAVRLTSKLFAD